MEKGQEMYWCSFLHRNSALHLSSQRRIRRDTAASNVVAPFGHASLPDLRQPFAKSLWFDIDCVVQVAVVVVISTVGGDNEMHNLAFSRSVVDCSCVCEHVLEGLVRIALPLEPSS